MTTTDFPETTIQKLKKELADSQLEDKLKSERIGELEKRAGEAKKIVEDYKKALPGLLEQHESFGNYYKTKSDMITKFLCKGARDCINLHIREYGDKIQEAEKKIKDQEGVIHGDKGVEQNVKSSTSVHDGKVQQFESLKNFQKAVQDGFKTLDGLSKEIEESDDGTKNELMFFLITDLVKSAWTEDLYEQTLIPGCVPEIQSLEKLDEINEEKMEELVEKAWKELNTAKEDLNKYQKDLSIEQEKLAALQADLDRLKSNRRKAIQDWIEEKDTLDMLKKLCENAQPTGESDSTD